MQLYSRNVQAWLYVDCMSQNALFVMPVCGSMACYAVLHTKSSTCKLQSLLWKGVVHSIYGGKSNSDFTRTPTWLLLLLSPSVSARRNTAPKWPYHVNSISTERTFRRSVGVGIGKDDKIWWWVEAMFWLLEWFSLHFSFSGRQDLLCFFLLFQHHSYKCNLISLCFGIQYNCHIFFPITFFWWIRYTIMGHSLATKICRLFVYIFS